MEHFKGFWTYLLDGASGMTFIGGWITGHDVLMMLGGLASVAAIINHASAFIERKFKDKK